MIIAILFPKNKPLMKIHKNVSFGIWGGAGRANPLRPASQAGFRPFAALTGPGFVMYTIK